MIFILLLFTTAVDSKQPSCSMIAIWLNFGTFHLKVYEAIKINDGINRY